MAKLISCESCGQEVYRGAICQKCGKDTRSFLEKHKIIIGVLIFMIIGAIGVIGIVSKGSAVDEENTSESYVEDSGNQEVISEENKSYNIGDTIELECMNLIVNRVYTVEGNEISTPKEGNEYIAVDCTVENTSSKDIGVSSLMMFKVVDSDGRKCDYSMEGLVAAKVGQLDDNVEPGKKLTGVYVVEVPIGTTGLELEFTEVFISEKKTIVKLN
ncbi:MAG: DUF4352 domain-containing protein [Clostridium sp.]